MKNQLTGEYGPVPDTARYYKVIAVAEVRLFTRLAAGFLSCAIIASCDL